MTRTERILEIRRLAYHTAYKLARPRDVDDVVGDALPAIITAVDRYDSARMPWDRYSAFVARAAVIGSLRRGQYRFPHNRIADFDVVEGEVEDRSEFGSSGFLKALSPQQRKAVVTRCLSPQHMGDVFKSRTLGNAYMSKAVRKLRKRWPTPTHAKQELYG